MGIKQDIIYGAVCLSLGLFAGREIGVFNSRYTQQVKSDSVLEQKIDPNEEIYAEMKNNYREITESLYESTRLANEIEKSIQESEKETKEMIIRDFKGSPGSPSGAGFGDLFDGPGQRRPIQDEPGSGTAEGLKDLFQGSGEPGCTAYERLARDLERAAESLQEIKPYVTPEYRPALQEIETHIKEGQKELEESLGYLRKEKSPEENKK